MNTDLLQAVATRSFTPSARDCDRLVALFLQEQIDLPTLTRTLLRAQGAALAAVQRAMRGAQTGPRRELAQLLGRLAKETSDGQSLLGAMLSDADRKVARAAVIALGKFPRLDGKLERSLIDLWSAWPDAADRRALAETLGKTGGPSALALLEKADLAEHAVLNDAIAQAKRRLTRTQARELETADTERFFTEVPLPAPWPIGLRVRMGLQKHLSDELSQLGMVPTAFQPATQTEPLGCLFATWRDPLAVIYRLRTFVDFGFYIPLLDLHPDEKTAPARLAQALGQKDVQNLLRTLTRGSLRCRFEFGGLASRRDFVRRVAQALSEHAPWLLDDPKACPWQVLPRFSQHRITGLLLCPKPIADPRFAYRQDLVPAASHPTLAAALVKTLQPQPGDVLWDPFVGSGAELCEAHLRCPSARLLGSDIDDQALDATRRNARAVGASVELVRADALSFWPAGVSCVLTNPPMGRRVCRGEVVSLLERFADHVSRRLAAGGRFCWLNPVPRRLGEILGRHGLRKQTTTSVDMNGFWAELELWKKDSLGW